MKRRHILAYTARGERLARNHKNFRKINKLRKCCGTKFESPSQAQHLVRIVHLGGYSLEIRRPIRKEPNKEAVYRKNTHWSDPVTEDEGCWCRNGCSSQPSETNSKRLMLGNFWNARNVAVWRKLKTIKQLKLRKTAKRREGEERLNSRQERLHWIARTCRIILYFSSNRLLVANWT